MRSAASTHTAGGTHFGRAVVERGAYSLKGRGDVAREQGRADEMQGNRWKEKRETAGAECKVGVAEPSRAERRAADSVAEHLRQRGAGFRTGLQAALWKWVPGSL